MPLMLEFGTRGPEVTVDQMLEGEGHTYLEVEQLLELVSEIYPRGEVVVHEGAPITVVSGLMHRGYPVRIER